MKVIAKNIPLEWYPIICLDDTPNDMLIEGRIYQVLSSGQNIIYTDKYRSYYRIMISEDCKYDYPVEWFYTEKELHDMKFNEKVDGLLK